MPRTPRASHPAISVVIPTYNEEKLIGRTVGNLRKLLPGSEIIVADGHSKDRTAAIARSKGAKVFFEHEHSVGGGRNAGAEHAHGDILWFVDADTFPNKHFLEEMARAFEDPKVVGVGGQVMPEDVGFAKELYFRFLNLIVYSAVSLGHPTIAGSCVAYRRSAFKKVKGFDTQTHSAEDFDLCLRVSKLGKVKFLPQCTVPTSDRRVHQLGIIGLSKDWTHATVMFLAGKKTSSYFAPR